MSLTSLGSESQERGENPKFSSVRSALLVDNVDAQKIDVPVNFEAAAI